MILTLAWLVLTLTVITIILLIDYRRFESSFQDLSLNIKTNLISKIKENEAVLEGFSAYISGIASADKIRGVVDKLRRKIEAPVQIEKLTLYVGVSIGTALYPDEVKNPIDLIDLRPINVSK